MKKTVQSSILMVALLSGTIGLYADNYGLSSASQYAHSPLKKSSAEALASKSKSESKRAEGPEKKNSAGSRKVVGLDTVLTDSLFGRKVYFRIVRTEAPGIFRSDETDTTDARLDCVTDRDSSIFTFKNAVDNQSFEFYRIPGKDARKSYLLHIEQYPSAPPSGNSAVIIAPVSGSLKALSPGEVGFNGELPNFSPGKITASPDEVVISVMNGYLGIQVPIRVESVGDSSFLVPPHPKVRTLSQATALNFKLTSPPNKSDYRENADITLYLDLEKKKAIAVKTPRFDQFQARSVWILMKPKAKKYSLQDMLNACSDLENALLEVRIGNTIGFISNNDLFTIGFKDVG